MREGLRNVVPIDVVAGTFGATLYGGGASGEMATFLIIVLAFLLHSGWVESLRHVVLCCLPAGSGAIVPGRDQSRRHSASAHVSGALPSRDDYPAALWSGRPCYLGALLTAGSGYFI